MLTAVEPTLVVETIREADAAGFRAITLTTTCDDELGERLLLALTARAYRIRALNRAHPTLEDVFLAATRRSWDVVDTPKAEEAKDRRPEAGPN